MTISTPAEVQQHYQDEEVAENYLATRFTEPLNVIEHERQVSILNTIIRENNCQKILEFAPGPARLTAELLVNGGTSIDSSATMLTIARNRMKQAGKKWNFVQGDLLTMDLKAEQDLVFSFRFWLHFHQEERDKIYAQARRALRPGGYLVFEALNRNIVLPLRKLLGMKRYNVYDHLYTRQELLAELENNGFRVRHLYPILSRFWIQAGCSRPLKLLHLKKCAVNLIRFGERFESSEPYEWVVLAQKK